MKYVYMLMWIPIAAMGIVLLRHHYKNLYNRWIGISLVVASTGSLGVSIRTSLLPILEKSIGLGDGAEKAFVVFSLLMILTYFYTLPFFILVSSLYFMDRIQERVRFGLIALLALPPMVTLGYQLTLVSVTELHTGLTRYWAPAYLAVALILYIYTAVTEPSPILKKNKVRIASVFGLAIVWAGTTDFWDIYRIDTSLSGFHIYSSGLWKYNVFIIAWMAVFFMYYGVRYGFLGIKLRIEQERHDYSMRALTMGTSILNHSLKNEIQKIDYLTERAKAAVESGDESVAQQSMDSLVVVTDHMMDMVGRIKQKADDIVLKESLAAIHEIVEHTMFFVEHLLKGKEVRFELDLGKPVILRCDEAHIRETLHNVVMNAVEALPPEGGTVGIRVHETKREIMVEVRDNGAGIEKGMLGKVLEPFFTTKRKPTNYGLGLSYCYSVMQKHGGGLAIDSEKGKGTTVTLRFPAKRRAAR